MTEIEQLRADLATIQEAAEIAKIQGFHELAGNYDQVEGELKQKIAKLEAQQALIDPWKRAKEALYHWDQNDREPDYITKRSIFAYVQNLQAKVDELNNELRCERIDGGKVRDDLKAEIAELKAKAKREQLDFCEECGYPLSDCGPPSVDGTPTTDCKVCQLKAQIAEMEQHGRKVDQANHEHYGRLQDQIAIRDLKIKKLEGQLAGRPVSEAAEALVKEVNEFKQREKLAELTTIANAIPPACGLARELVEQRIEGVKKEMQGNG